MFFSFAAFHTHTSHPSMMKQDFTQTCSEFIKHADQQSFQLLSDDVMTCIPLHLFKIDYKKRNDTSYAREMDPML